MNGEGIFNTFRNRLAESQRQNSLPDNSCMMGPCSQLLSNVAAFVKADTIHVVKVVLQREALAQEGFQRPLRNAQFVS